jgi:hypothetical protein
MKYIYHHLGLGDHIVCNGMVRSLIKSNEKYTIFVKSHNYDTIKFMYRDIDNLDYMIGDDLFVVDFLNKNKISMNNLLIGGFMNFTNSKSFDESFYLQNNIPFENRWEKFKVIRDYESEIVLFKKFNVTEKNYIFIHDDERYPINTDKINNPNNLPIVKCVKGLTDNIFDFCYLIENASQCHTIESSLQFMIDSLYLNSENYVHRYCRPLPEWEKPQYKTVKKIID